MAGGVRYDYWTVVLNFYPNIIMPNIIIFQLAVLPKIRIFRGTINGGNGKWKRKTETERKMEMVVTAIRTQYNSMPG